MRILSLVSMISRFQTSKKKIPETTQKETKIIITMIINQKRLPCFASSLEQGRANVISTEGRNHIMVVE